MVLLWFFVLVWLVGKIVECFGKKYVIEEVKLGVFVDVDVVFFVVGGLVIKVFVLDVIKDGCLVIDKSFVYCMDLVVLLVILEINL